MRLAIPCLVLLLVGGCAALKNTPIQDYVWEMGKHCEHVNSGWRVTQVDTSGRYYISGTNVTSPADFYECMNEQYRRRPFNAWLAAQQRGGPSGTSAPVPSPAPGAPAGGAAAVAQGLAVWKTGYEWTFRYAPPTGAGGVFLWAVDREEMVDGVASYVIRSGTREIFVRKTDLAFSIDKINGALAVRRNPPSRFFSNTPGEQWEVRYDYEQPQERRTREVAWLCEASGPESITVPTGTYEAVKTSCKNARTSALVYEVWYAPAVKQMVRERTLRTGGWEERELVGLKIY